MQEYARYEYQILKKLYRYDTNTALPDIGSCQLPGNLTCVVAGIRVEGGLF